MQPIRSERYRNFTLIGEGVSAMVYKALDTHTSSVVAVKVLNPRLQTDDISLERFRREIQITRFLGHPQIVSIYDLVAEAGQVYLVMEYIDGANLKDFIQLHAPVDIDTVVSILTQTLKILSLCHAKNVIHRDLKPQNMILMPDGLVKLLDFGISRMTTLSDLTQTGTSLGSPEYMAPELFATSAYDPRSDLYALGVIVFELLTGELPFKGDSLAVLFHQHHTAPVPAMSRYRGDVPEWLQHLAERMLAKNSYERYQSADEVLGDIERRQVVARELPQLEKRECVNCGAATIAEVPLCTFCGYIAVRQHGGFDVCCAEDADRDAIARYFHTVFNVPTRRIRKRATLLICAIDRVSAEVLRRNALRHGIVLTVKKRSPFGLLKKVAAVVVMAWCAWCVLNIMSSLLLGGGGASRVGWNADRLYLITVIQGALLALLGWVALAAFRREAVWPVFRKISLLGCELEREHQWLKELAGRTKAGADDPTQQFLSQMLEKYLLLVRSTSNVPGDIKNSLQQVLLNAARLARVAAEIDARLNAPALARHTAAYQALTGEIESETDPVRRDQLRHRRQAVASKLEQSSALGDQHAALMNKLIYLQYVFNTLLGKVVVSRLPLESYDADLLDGCLRSLREEVGIRRQVETELSKVA